MQPLAAQIESADIEQSTIQSTAELIVQPLAAQLPNLPNFLNLTTLTNHFQILNACKTIEERIFYVLYSYKERLNKKEMLRCLKNNTFAPSIILQHLANI